MRLPLVYRDFDRRSAGLDYFCEGEGGVMTSRNILHFSFYGVGIKLKGLKTFRLREECHNIKLPINMFEKNANIRTTSNHFCCAENL